MTEAQTCTVCEEQHEIRACPFYGHNPYGLYSKGNQCPFKSGHAPCEMELAGKEPDLELCPLPDKAVRLP